MATTMTRRSVLAGGVAALTLASLGSPARAAAERIRFLWWGSQERADRTMAALNAYKGVAPDLEVTTEFAGWADYWPRLATQVAGRNAPDLIQMDYRYIFEYARRGTLLALDDYLDKSLKIADFGAPNIDSGRVDGKLFGINLGVNSSCMIYDAVAWEKSGATPPAAGQTWEQFAESAAKMSENKPKPGFYATQDGSGVEPGFELWLRQNGKSLFSPEGTVGYEPADAAKWFALWAGLRDSGACVPADIQALDQLTIETNALTTGKAATAFVHSNQFVGYQKLNKSKLALSPYPLSAGGGPSGHYLKPSMLLSLSATSPVAESVVALANFMVADPAGVKALGVERGVPASGAMRDQLTASGLSEVDTAMVDYIAAITPGVGPLPPPPPPGAGEAGFVLLRISQEVAFGSTTPEDAGEKLVAETAAILKRG